MRNVTERQTQHSNCSTRAIPEAFVEKSVSCHTLPRGDGHPAPGESPSSSGREFVPSWVSPPRSRLLLGKLTVVSNSRDFPRSVQPKGSLPYLQKPTTGPYPGPHKYNLHSPAYFSKIQRPLTSLPKSIFHSSVQVKIVCIQPISPMLATCSTHLVLFGLIIVMILGGRVRLRIMNSSLHNFLPFPVTWVAGRA
jgi:hypothetical protein